MSKETIKVFTSFISNTASTLCNPRHVAILIIISQNLRCKARRFLMPYKDPEKRRAAARLGMQKMRAKEKGLTKTVNIARNRKRGKRYEGELVKLLRESGIFARLGRSNEEGDLILPELNIVIEAKSTTTSIYRMSMNRSQYTRLSRISQEKWYAVRFMGKHGGWEFFPFPPSIQVLHRGESLTYDEFVKKLQTSLEEKEGQKK